MKRHRIMHALVAFAVAALPLRAADYIQPEFTKQLFALDKIPLKVDRMKELSRHLVAMARRDQDSSAQARRATAQLLALAARLDPTNQDVRQTNKTFAEGSFPSASSEEEIQRAKARIRFFNRWLGSEDAGAEANKLHNYLSDAASASEGKSSQLAQWEGVVSPLEKYKGAAVVSREMPKERNGEEAVAKKEPQPSKDGADTASTAKFQIEKLKINTPMVLVRYQKYRDENDGFKEKHRAISEKRIASVGMKAVNHNKHGKTEVFLHEIVRKQGGRHENDEIEKQVSHSVKAAIGKLHPGLGNYRVDAASMGGQYARYNEAAISAPLAVLMHASVSNRHIRPDVCVLGEINSDGEFVMPGKFWKLLEIVRQSKTGGRLIVPADSASLLTQILVYEESEFFTRWEVIGVKTLAEALDVAKINGQQEHDRAGELFTSIRALAEKSSVPKLTTNSKVRERLAEIVKLAPGHFSAKALLLQGSTRRPRELSKLTLGYELGPIVKQVSKALYGVNPDGRDHRAERVLRTAHEETRAVLDPLERRIDRDHKEIYQRVLSHCDGLRRCLVLAKRANKNKEDHTAKNKLKQLHREMLRENENLALLIETLIKTSE